MTQSRSKESNGGSSKKLPVDTKQLKSLVDLMVENDLTRLELREGETHILLRRGGSPVHALPAMPVAANPSPVAAPAPATAARPAAPADVAGEGEVLIRSPMVGTFYAAPEPDSPPFVNVGTAVSQDSIVCLIEAMKVFNEIKAEISGEITKVLVKNAAAVEYDQPLFVVKQA